MKKILSIAILIAVPLLFIGCSNNDDNSNDALLQNVQGKWKLTIITSDVAGEDQMIENGYEIELKSDHTFTSNELPGYTGGTYTTISNPGNNIKFIFKNSSGSVVRYKYINHTFDHILYTQALQEAPLSNEFEHFGVQVLQRLIVD